jgi:hypothetical protein
MCEESLDGGAQEAHVNGCGQTRSHIELLRDLG